MKRLFKSITPSNMLMLTVAGIVNAIGVTFFLAPVKIYDSGISGTSILFSQLTPEFFTLSFFILVLNIPLFLYGLKKQGSLFTFYAIYSVVIYSLTAFLITDILPIDVSFASPLAKEDLLLCALFGGVISGIGSGTAIRFGGAMDGIEVMAVIFAKKIGISVGTFVMIYNMILYISAGIIIGDWILPLYSIVAYTASLKTVDFIVDGIDHAKCAIIITEEPDKICEELSHTFESGTTKIKAVGGYSNTEKTMVYFIVNRFQVVRLKELVHSIDQTAYITISEVTDVFSVNRDKKVEK